MVILKYMKLYFSLEQTYPLAPFATFGPVLLSELFFGIAYRESLSDLSLVAAAFYFLVGIILWTLIEYILHRFFFHATSDNHIMKQFNSGLHLLHHNDPASPRFIAAPMALGIPVYALFMTGCLLVTQNLVLTTFLGAGITVGYLLYEWVHYAAHVLKATNPISKYWKKYHLVHHFKHPDRFFGVTSPIWDIVVGVFERHP